MSEEKQIKFKQEDLQSLKDLQTNYLSLQTQFGQLHMAKLNLKKQFDDLGRVEEETRQKFEEVQKEEANLIETLKQNCRRIVREKTGKKPFTNINIARI